MALTLVEIVVPLPPREMHPSVRVHWRRKLVPKRQQRSDAWIAGSGALCGLAPPFWESAKVEATFWMPRRMDPDGLISWLKATFDGLQDAGIILNDSNLTILPPRQVTGKDSLGRRQVVLVVRVAKE